MADLYSTLKNIGINVLGGGLPSLAKSAATKAKDAVTALPGVKAAVQSVKEGSTEPYKQFIAEHPIAQDVRTAEGQKKASEIALNVSPFGLLNAEKGIVTKLVKESTEEGVKKLLSNKKYFDLARQAIDEYTPKITKSKMASEIEGFIGEAKTISKSATEKLIDAVRNAKPQREKIAIEQSAARAKKATEAIAASQGKSGREAFYAELGKLKGELTPTQSETGSLEGAGKGKLNPEDVTTLFNTVRAKSMSFYDKLSAQNGLERLLEGDVPPPSQLSLLEDVFGSDLVQALKDRRSFKEKAKEVTFEILADIPRALKTTMDLSATLRQGAKMVIRHPKIGYDAFIESAKNVFSEKRFNLKLDELKSTGAYQTMQDSGLFIADPRKLVGNREEYFTSNLAEKIPFIKHIVKASNRAYVSFLNNLRADVFNDFVKNNPNLSKNDLKSLGGFINTATGRGSLGSLERYTTFLSKVFFAPRYVSSQLSFFNPFWYAKQTPVVRKEAAKTMASYVGTITSMLTLAKMGGADVEIDPRSSNFGKMAVPSDSSINSVIKAAIPSFLGIGTQTFDGKTHYDLTFGSGQYVRLAAQLLSGQKKTQSGKIEDLNSGKPFTETRLGVATNVIRGKLAPFLSTMADLLAGKNVVGEEVTFLPKGTSIDDFQKSALIDNLIPLYTQDIIDILQQPSKNDSLGIGGNTTLPQLPTLPKLSPLPKLPKLQNLPKIE